MKRGSNLIQIKFIASKLNKIYLLKKKLDIREQLLTETGFLYLEQRDLIMTQ